MTTNKKNIVVLGGGFAGVEIAKTLDASLRNTHRVVLIERKSHFFHSIGAVRTLAQDNYEQQLFVPYDQLLKHGGVVVHATATEIHKKEIVVDNEVDFGLGATTVVPFEYLVIATGSNYPSPFKANGESKDRDIEVFQAQRAAVKKARKILIIGGGPIGIEFAGELASTYKDKEITIVHAGERLLSADFPKKLTDRLERILKSLNVRVILNERMQFPEGFSFTAQDLKERTFTTDKGTEVLSDLQFNAMGATANTAIVETLDASLLESDTRLVRVQPTLQLEDGSYAHIFAAGDITNIRETKMAFRAGHHAGIISKNIIALVNGKKLVEYKPAPPMILVTAGKQKGAGLLPMAGGMVVGGFMSRNIKGKDLFVSRKWKELTGGSMPAEVKMTQK